MAYDNSMMELTELCEILNREVRRINDRLDNSNGPILPEDARHVETVTHAIANIKKSMHFAKEMEMLEDYEPYGASRRNIPPRHMSHNFDQYGKNDDYGRDDSYGRGRERNSRGQFMDGETSHMVREIMGDTKDERTRDQLRKLLERM